MDICLETRRIVSRSKIDNVVDDIVKLLEYGWRNFAMALIALRDRGFERYRLISTFDYRSL
jgi:hypothetical protein